MRRGRDGQPPGMSRVSLKFNLKGKKEELNVAICKLERIRKNIDYIISCNGDFTEKKFKEIVANC